LKEENVLVARQSDEVGCRGDSYKKEVFISVSIRDKISKPVFQVAEKKLRKLKFFWVVD